MSDLNPNIYWEVAGKRYYRKVEALRASTSQRNAKIIFHYYDEAFSKYPWFREPRESFNDLAAQRAQQIRDTNKYVRLWYSGGSDSHTMLHAFLDNNVLIDEIVMVRAHPTNAFDSEACAETNLRSLPYIQSMKHELRKTKISLVDIGSEQYKNYYKNTDWFVETTTYDFGDDPGLILGGRDSIARHSNLGMPEGCVEVTGANKPKVVRRNGIYFVPIFDSYIEYPYWNNIRPFFTTPEFPALHAKQCHELKKIVHRHYPDGDLDGDIYAPNVISQDFRSDWYHCCRIILNYQMDYGKSWKLLSPKSQMRAKHALEHQPEILKYFRGTLSELHSEVSHYWEHMEDSVDTILGKVYNLGRWNPPQ